MSPRGSIPTAWQRLLQSSECGTRDGCWHCYQGSLDDRFTAPCAESRCLSQSCSTICTEHHSSSSFFSSSGSFLLIVVANRAGFASAVLLPEECLLWRMVGQPWSSRCNEIVTFCTTSLSERREKENLGASMRRRSSSYLITSVSA